MVGVGVPAWAIGAGVSVGVEALPPELPEPIVMVCLQVDVVLIAP